MEKYIQSYISKTIVFFTLAVLVMSMTGAAASNTSGHINVPRHNHAHGYIQDGSNLNKNGQSDNDGSTASTTSDTGFETVHPHEGNTYWVGADGHLISLLHNNSAVNPTYSQLLSFIKNDQTDQRKYAPGQYTCGDFAETVQNNAEKAGYKAGWVTIEGINHCCNVFQTSDNGLIYIDCTGSPDGGGSWDSSVKLANGIEYQRIPLFKDNFYFNSMGTVISFKEYW